MDNDTRAYHLLSPDELAKVDKGKPPRGPKMKALMEVERRTHHNAREHRPTYEQVLAARREAYTERLSITTIPQALVDWAERMKIAHSDTVHVHSQLYLDWVVGFFVVRYGEDPEKWPLKLTEEEVVPRADAWESFRDWPSVARIPSRATPMPLTYKVEG